MATYSSLGFKGQDNKWTDLLGAVTQKKVDVALDAVIKTAERSEDMFFTHKIMKSMYIIADPITITCLALLLWIFRRNIYVKPKESNEIRDIFLAPFGIRLVLSVFGTFLILAAMVFVIDFVISKTTHHLQRTLGVSDSVMWCVAVLTMQGAAFRYYKMSWVILL